MPKGDNITIYFEDNNLDRLVLELEQKGIVFNQLPEDKSWLWCEAHLQDPDGNPNYFIPGSRKLGKSNLMGYSIKSS